MYNNKMKQICHTINWRHHKIINVSYKIITCTIKLNIYSMKLIIYNITCTKHKNNDKYFEIRKAQHNIN